MFECTLDKVNEDIRNVASVEAHPINPDGTPTNQSPVDAADAAHVTTEPRPGISMIKAVQPAGTAVAYASDSLLSLGQDAQDITTAAMVPYGENALYRIAVMKYRQYLVKGHYAD